jgi:hypothetical protein
MRTPALTADRAPWRTLLGLFSLGLLGACGGGGAGGGADPSAATLRVRMQDTPVDGADQVIVTIDRVEVFRRGASGEVKETLVSTPAQYDLLELQNGISTLLGSGHFPDGDYSSIRLIVAADSKHDLATLPADQLKNYIVVDGVACPLIVPSGSQSGIKLNHGFTLSPGAVTELTLDFDVRKSVHQRGHRHQFNLCPSIRVIETPGGTPGPTPGPTPGATLGTISGTVSTADASPLPAGTVVSAQQFGSEIASAIVDSATGAYHLASLPDGLYDLVALAPGYGFAYETGVSVIAPQDSSGHDFWLSPASTGGISGQVAFSTTDPSIVVVHVVWNGFLVASTGIDPVTGDYGFTSLPIGDYNVAATDGTLTYSGSDPTTVTDGGTATADFTLP